MGGWDIHQESPPKRGPPSQLFTKILAMGGWDIHQESFVLKGLVPLVNKNAPFFLQIFRRWWDKPWARPGAILVRAPTTSSGLGQES